MNIFTDGACKKDGRGGWAYVVHPPSPTASYQGFGGERDTTNNRMELMACIKALESVVVDGTVLNLTTDSNYVVLAFNDGWLENWKTNGWRSANKKPVKNKDLWEQLDAHNKRLKVTWIHVDGHTGHTENELCDKLASKAAFDQ